MRSIATHFLFAAWAILGLYALDIIYTKNEVRHVYLCEYAYMCGQAEALNGDVRVRYVRGQWHWVKSPWNEDTAKKNFHVLYSPQTGVEKSEPF